VQIGGVDRVARRRAYAYAYALGARWHPRDEDSELTRINRAGGAPVVVSGETARLVETAMTAHRWTAGAFDPLSIDLAEHAQPARWRAGVDLLTRRSARRPSIVDEVIVLHSASDLAIVRLPVGVALDVSALAAGFAADLILHDLCADRPAAERSVYVDIGDVMLVRNPDLNNVRPIGVGLITEAVTLSLQLTVGAGALATAGIGERPGAGPFERSLPSGGSKIVAAVIAPEGWRAAVLASAAGRKTVDEAAAMIEGCGATGLLVTPDGHVRWLADAHRFLAAG
jgi:thiamine biosynthesis lipoprotein ApbE